MPNFTNNEWIAVAVGAAFLMLAWQKGWLSQWFGKIQPKPASQPMVQAYMEPTVAPQSLDDRVVNAYQVFKAVADERATVQRAYGTLNAVEEIAIAEEAKRLAKVNAMAAKVEAK